MRASCPRPPFISDLPFHTSLLCDSRFGTLHLASQASLTWPYTTAFSALLPNYASSDNGRPARAPHLIESSDSWMRRARFPLRCLPPISLSLRVLSSTKPSVTTCTRQLCITHSEFHVPHPPLPKPTSLLFFECARHVPAQGLCTSCHAPGTPSPRYLLCLLPHWLRVFSIQDPSRIWDSLTKFERRR